MPNKDKITKLKDIPAVDKILIYDEVKELTRQYNADIVKYSIHRTLPDLRRDLKQKRKSWSKKEIIEKIEKYIDQLTGGSLKRVINATGIVLHTNLGRAPLGEKVLEELTPIIKGYSNLEYDLGKAKRGDRNDHLTELLKFITRSEAALVVNNNAAAVLLILMTFAKNREVIVSRGELIEIGGSFRLPDVMKASGALMKEVGTTNRTTLSDYEEAINENTSIIFKAHKSNYYMRGFTREVEVPELAGLAHDNNLMMVYDVGSGLLKQPQNIDLSQEPDIRNIIQKGTDIACFSGDKLLGGPQAGLRVGKMTISALSTVIRFYLNESKLKYNKMFEILDTPLHQIKHKAEKLQNLFAENDLKSEIKTSTAKTGGGTVPAKDINSFTVQLTSLQNKKEHETIFLELLKLKNPVISILREGALHFDVLTLEDGDMKYIAESVKKIKEIN